MKLSLLLLAAAALCTNMLKADTIYQNFAVNGYSQDGTGLNPDPEAAVPFIVPTPQSGYTYFLTTIQFAAYTLDSTDTITVALFSNNNSTGLPSQQVPGASISGIVLPTDQGPALTTVDFTSDQIALQTGVQYWVVLKDTGGDSTWNQNENNINGAASFGTFPNNFWTSNSDAQGAVEVNAEQEAPAPEPGTLVMLVGGALALLFMGARRKSRPAIES